LSIEETAHHEAGHAVAAIKSGKSFRYVTIDPNEYSRGRVVFKTGFKRNMRSRVLCENNAIIALAGPIAERTPATVRLGAALALISARRSR